LREEDIKDNKARESLNRPLTSLPCEFPVSKRKTFPVVELPRIEKQLFADMRPSDKKWLIDRIRELGTQLDQKHWELIECIEKGIELQKTINRILEKKGDTL